MKTIKIAILGLFLMIANATNAQVSVNINIGATPDWAPVGYKTTEYYYLPDIQSYYDVRASQFIYFGGGNWRRSSRLPHQYRDYDLYNGHTVVLNDYHGRTPYVYHDKHRVRYNNDYRGEKQSCHKPRRENDYYGRYDKNNHHKKHDNYYDNRNNHNSRNEDYGRNRH